MSTYSEQVVERLNIFNEASNAASQAYQAEDYKTAAKDITKCISLVHRYSFLGIIYFLCKRLQ